MDIGEIRSQFPIVKAMAYFDIAYANPLANCVREASELFMANFQTRGVKKPEYLKMVEVVRNKFASLINATPSEVALVKNTSEGLNIAANGIKFKPGDNIVLNGLEHLNNVMCWLRLRKKNVEIRIVPEKNGRVDLADIAANVDSRTRAVAIASITNLGFRFNLQKLSGICKENSAYLVVDAIQSLGIDPMDVRRLGIDVLSSSAHKGLLGPHGIGFFYCNEEIIDEIEPVYVAQSSYERVADLIPCLSKLRLENTPEIKDSAAKFEYGNHNYTGVYAMEAALNLLEKAGVEEIGSHAFALARTFRQKLRSVGIDVLDSANTEEQSHIVTFSLSGDSSKEVEKLNEKRIRVSGHYGKMRASFALYNNFTEVERAVKIIADINISNGLGT